jgi:hypothetical protein
VVGGPDGAQQKHDFIIQLELNSNKMSS